MEVQVSPNQAAATASLSAAPKFPDQARDLAASLILLISKHYQVSKKNVGSMQVRDSNCGTVLCISLLVKPSPGDLWLGPL